MKKNKRADFLINQALQTFIERRKVYGDSYIMHAKVMAAMFPDGVTLKTDVDMARWSVLNLIMIKLIRYIKDFKKPHQDSIHDCGVYSFVLEELDQAEDGKINLTELVKNMEKFDDSNGS
jgi:hypothetical protein